MARPTIRNIKLTGDVAQATRWVGWAKAKAIRLFNLQGLSTRTKQYRPKKGVYIRIVHTGAIADIYIKVKDDDPRAFVAESSAAFAQKKLTFNKGKKTYGVRDFEILDVGNCDWHGWTQTLSWAGPSSRYWCDWGHNVSDQNQEYGQQFGTQIYNNNRVIAEILEGEGKLIGACLQRAEDFDGTPITYLIAVTAKNGGWYADEPGTVSFWRRPWTGEPYENNDKYHSENPLGWYHLDTFDLPYYRLKQHINESGFTWKDGLAAPNGPVYFNQDGTEAYLFISNECWVYERGDIIPPGQIDRDLAHVYAGYAKIIITPGATGVDIGFVRQGNWGELEEVYLWTADYVPIGFSGDNYSENCSPYPNQFCNNYEYRSLGKDGLYFDIEENNGNYLVASDYVDNEWKPLYLDVTFDGTPKGDFLIKGYTVEAGASSAIHVVEQKGDASGEFKNKLIFPSGLEVDINHVVAEEFLDTRTLSCNNCNSDGIDPTEVVGPEKFNNTRTVAEVTRCMLWVDLRAEAYAAYRIDQNMPEINNNLGNQRMSVEIFADGAVQIDQELWYDPSSQFGISANDAHLVYTRVFIDMLAYTAESEFPPIITYPFAYKAPYQAHPQYGDHCRGSRFYYRMSSIWYWPDIDELELQRAVDPHGNTFISIREMAYDYDIFSGIVPREEVFLNYLSHAELGDPIPVFNKNEDPVNPDYDLNDIQKFTFIGVV